MIPVQTIVDRMKFALDAEGSDRYLFDQDFKPAINSTIDFVVALFNRAFSDNKLTEENLRELIKTKVWRASTFSRIKFDSVDVGDELWSIIGIFPEPITNVPAPPFVPASPDESKLVDEVSFISSDFDAKRLTPEQWSEGAQNIFMAGNKTLLGGLKSYAYLNFSDYSSDDYSTNEEITIRPDVSGQLIAMKYLKMPVKINVIGDNIEFPSLLTDLIYQKALNYISIKQGDNTNLFSITEREVNRFVQVMS